MSLQRATLQHTPMCEHADRKRRRKQSCSTHAVGADPDTGAGEGTGSTREENSVALGFLADLASFMLRNGGFRKQGRGGGDYFCHSPPQA